MDTEIDHCIICNSRGPPNEFSLSFRLNSRLEYVTEILPDLSEISSILGYPVDSLGISRDGSQSSEISNDEGESPIISNEEDHSSEISNDGGQSSEISIDGGQSSEISIDGGQSSEISNDGDQSSEISNDGAQSSVISNEGGKSSEILNDGEQSSEIPNDERGAPIISNEEDPNPGISNEDDPYLGISNEEDPYPGISNEDDPYLEISIDDGQYSGMSNDENICPEILNYECPSPEMSFDEDQSPEMPKSPLSPFYTVSLRDSESTISATSSPLLRDTEMPISIATSLETFYVLKLVFKHPLDHVTTEVMMLLVQSPSDWFEICPSCRILVSEGLEVVNTLKEDAHKDKREYDELAEKLENNLYQLRSKFLTSMFQRICLVSWEFLDLDDFADTNTINFLKTEAEAVLSFRHILLTTALQRLVNLVNTSQLPLPVQDCIMEFNYSPAYSPEILIDSDSPDEYQNDPLEELEGEIGVPDWFADFEEEFENEIFCDCLQELN